MCREIIPAESGSSSCEPLSAQLPHMEEDARGSFHSQVSPHVARARGVIQLWPLSQQADQCCPHRLRMNLCRRFKYQHRLPESNGVD